MKVGWKENLSEQRTYSVKNGTNDDSTSVIVSFGDIQQASLEFSVKVFRGRTLSASTETVFVQG